jgi:hypothetical protein
MGAKISYEKDKGTLGDIDFTHDIENLSSFLNQTTQAGQSKPSQGIEFENLRDKYPSLNLTEDGKTKFNNTVNNTEKIKRSLDLIQLYDNYNLKNNVIIKDLSKKYNNQIAEIKNRNESTDLLSHDLNVIKNKVNKNKIINRNLLIFIIIFVLIIITLLCIIAYKIMKL